MTPPTPSQWLDAPSQLIVPLPARLKVLFDGVGEVVERIEHEGARAAAAGWVERRLEAISA